MRRFERTGDYLNYGKAADYPTTRVRSNAAQTHIEQLTSPTSRASYRTAVTIPWIIGVNPRGAPRLSDYLAFLPHVSAIVPISDGSGETPKPRIALGLGLALAKAFTFSVGWPVKGDADTYLLMGISATDLVDTFKALK